jgi:hypothetical protein
VKYISAKEMAKFRLMYHGERVPSKQTIHNLVNKFRSAGLLTDKKQKRKCSALTEDKLYNVGARFEHIPIKSLKISSSRDGCYIARKATQLLKLRPYKAAAIHALQPCNPASWVNFFSWFLHSVIKGEIDPQLTFYLMKCGFTYMDK